MGVMSFSGWHSPYEEARPKTPTSSPTGTHASSWLRFRDQGLAAFLRPFRDISTRIWLISSVGKISSACLGFRFNWPRTSFSLPDFQSTQDLIIKEPACSTCPGGSIFLERSEGREAKTGSLAPILQLLWRQHIGEDPDHTRAVLSPTPPHEARPTLYFLEPLTTAGP